MWDELIRKARDDEEWYLSFTEDGQYVFKRKERSVHELFRRAMAWSLFERG